MSLAIGSLFAGIGGLELGLEQAGVGHVVWQAESDPFCREVLARHWPSAKRYTDVREIDATAPHADVLCGGFPCQDISNAGERAGIEGERSGLWAEFARIIGVVRPSLVVVENVAALLGRGLDRVLGDLSSLGFDAEWSVVRASDVGAPHRRERVFIVANDRRGRLQRRAERGGLGEPQGARAGEAVQRQRRGDDAGHGGAPLAHGDGGGRQVERLAEPGGLGGARGDLAHGHGAPRQQHDAPARELGDAHGEGLEERAGKPRDERAQLAAAERAGAVADPDGLLGRAPAGPRSARHADAPVGDAHGNGRGEGRGQLPAGQPDARGAGAPMGDAAGARREGADGLGGPLRERGEAFEPERSGDAGGNGGAPLAGLGGGLDGVPPGLDGDPQGPRWPAPPGHEPHAWEPPRTITGPSPNRPARLRALGNAVVPAVGRKVGQRILATFILP